MLPHNAPSPHNKFRASHKVESPLCDVSAKMESAVAAQDFTAWSFGTQNGLTSCFFADEVSIPGIGLANLKGPFHPIFDLGSLTKPLFLNSILRRKIQDKFSYLLEPLISFYHPQNSVGEVLLTYLRKYPYLRAVDFLDHTSGIRKWFWFGRGAWLSPKGCNEGENSSANTHLNIKEGFDFEQAFSRTIVSGCFQRFESPCQNTIYSDPNYFLLAKILEQNSFSVDFDWQTALSEMNADLKTQFFHVSLNPKKSILAVPFYPYISNHKNDLINFNNFEPSYGCSFDTNANILSSVNKKNGIVSGHAGLFGSVADVVAAVQHLQKSQVEFLHHQCLKKYMLGREKNSRFAMGLDTPAGEKTLAGVSRWPLDLKTQIYGHLGFTGTSFWFAINESDPLELHVLLTNRTASRKCYSAFKIPRILVKTHFPSSTSEYYMTKKEAEWEPISEDTALDIIQTFRNSSKISWDQETIRSFPDIGALRTFAGRRLWSL